MLVERTEKHTTQLDMPYSDPYNRNYSTKRLIGVQFLRMILSCPACNTRFELDDSLLGTRGRKVRCGKCAHSWHQKASHVEPDPFDTAHRRRERSADLSTDRVKLEAPLPPAPFKAEQSERSGGALGWVVLLLFVASVLGGAWFWRDAIVTAVPQAERFYQLIGLGPPLPGTGLEIQNVNSIRERQEDDRVLFIEGEVLNVSDVSVKVPAIHASLADADGNEVFFWVFTADTLELAPGEIAYFETTARNPPEKGANIRIAFSSPEISPVSEEGESENAQSFMQDAVGFVEGLIEQVTE